ncbi:MAG: helix-turn-helix transcriptional regulator [Candidatus Krumholzibacteriota bacterium]|nr:helix-turn-helix transcriptional regulator [Candidatus Krumholzibacteriota bacterium]
MHDKNEIGACIKNFRLSKGLTLKDIEVRAKVSATHVSEIERGMTSPTVGALAKIAEAMGTDVSYFVEKRNLRKVSVVSKKKRKAMQFMDWGATYYSLTKDLPNPKISFLEVELEPGIARPEETSTHEGEEFALVTKGVMEIIIGGDKFILKEGDSIHYKADKPHAMRNIGDARCRAIWVTLPPYSL